MSVTVTMTARQVTQRDKILVHGLSDGGHSIADSHDPVFMIVYVINQMFRDMHDKTGVICDTIVRVIST